MKTKISLAFIAVIMFSNCQKENISNQIKNDLILHEELKEDQVTADLINQKEIDVDVRNEFPIISIKLTVYTGTRKTDDKSTEYPCDGRSICIKAGLTIADDGETPVEGKYILELARVSIAGDLVAQISKRDITPTDLTKISQGGVFILDGDLSLDPIITSRLGILSHKTIPEGEYKITDNGDFIQIQF